MHLHKHHPPRLFPYIKYCYSLRAESHELPDSLHRHLPDGTAELIINLGSPVEQQIGPDTWTVRPQRCFGGLYHSHHFLRYTGNIHLMGAIVNPGYGPLFTSDDISQVVGILAPAGDFFGQPEALLYEQMQMAETDQQRFNLLEAFLWQIIQRQEAPAHAQGIARAVHAIHAAQGNISLPQMYQAALMSERNFRRRFGELVGIPPKQYARIVRIKSFVKRHKQTQLPFAQLLYQHGYSDHAHFANDFNSLAGITPTLFFNQLNGIDREFIHAGGQNWPIFTDNR